MSSLAQTVLIERTRPEVRADADASVRSRVGTAAIIALVIAAPFERALAAIPGGFTITTLEAATLAVLTVTTVGLWRLALSERRESKDSRASIAITPRPLVAPGLVFLVVLFVAALAAPLEAGNALRLVARMAAASLIVVATAATIDTLAAARAVARAFVTVATVIAFIAVLELMQFPLVMDALTIFRPGFHVVAGQLRATSTLLYPTIASMYLELAFALGLWLLLDRPSTRHRRDDVLVFGALCVIGAGITATFTRAGLAGMAAAIVVVAAVRLMRLPRSQSRIGTLAALSAVLVGIVLLAHTPERLATRLTTEGSQEWYGATYQVPAHLQLDTGHVHEIPVTVSNTGRLAWDSASDPAFAMSYHWLRSGSEAVIHFDGQRTPFASPVQPGRTVTLPVTVRAPGQPGAYTLVWDVVHEHRAWLSTEGVTPARTEVVVQGAPASAVVTVMPRLPRSSVRLPRPELWRAALRIAADRPWLGLGPDNFRHAYGRYLGLERWDPRVHANNMYLEVLTGAGVVGLLSLVWLVGKSGLVLARRCRDASPTQLTAASAFLAAWLMVAGHGLVDSFLSFSTTYVAFAVVAGLAFSSAFARESSTGELRRDRSASARGSSAGELRRDKSAFGSGHADRV